MADETRTLDQLPEAVSVSAGDLMPIQSPGGPMQAVEARRLFGTLQAADAAVSTVAELATDADAQAVAEGGLVVVFADPDAAKSGYWIRSGPAADAWSQTDLPYARTVAAVQPLVDGAQAARAGAEVARAGAEQATVAIQARIGVSPAPPASFTLGQVAVNGTFSTNNSTIAIGHAEPTPVRSVLRAVIASYTGAALVQVLVVDDLGKIIAFRDNVPVVAGSNRLPFDPPITVPASTRALVRKVSGTGQLKRNDAQGYYATFAVPANAAVGVSVVVGIASDAYLYAVAGEYLPIGSTIEGDLAANSAALAQISDSLPRLPAAPAPTGVFAGFSKYLRGFDAGGADLPVGATVTGVTADLAADPALAYVRTEVFRRPVAATLDTPTAQPEDETVVVRYAKVGDLGLTAARKLVTIAVPTFTVAAGFTYYVRLSGLTAGQALVTLQLGSIADEDARQRHRGWFSSGSAAAAGLSARMVFAGRAPGTAGGSASGSAAVQAGYDDRIVAADAGVNGLTVTLAGTLDRNGSPIAFGETRAFAASAAGKARYVLWCYAPETGAFSVVNGAERSIPPGGTVPDAHAPIAYPKRTSAAQRELFVVRITDSALSIVSRWDIYDGRPLKIVDQMDRELERNRRLLARTRALAARGALTAFTGLGDSITAIQTADPSFTAPNGASRDRAPEIAWMLTGYGADQLAAIALYTAAESNRPDDGAGAVHSRYGWNWELWRALIGTNPGLRYDNFGFAGMTSATPVVEHPEWLAASAALANPLVIIAFGMNDQRLGTSTTEQNIVDIVAAHRAQRADAEFVVLGCPDPNGPRKVEVAQVNRRMKWAAEFAGAAFLSMEPLYRPDFMGAIGLTPIDRGAAGPGLHIGFQEHAAIGRALVRMLAV